MAWWQADVFRRGPNLQFDFQLVRQGAVYLQYQPGVPQRFQIMERSSGSQVAWKNHPEGSPQRWRGNGQFNIVVYPREPGQGFYAQTVDAERYPDAASRSGDARRCYVRQTPDRARAQRHINR